MRGSEAEVTTQTRVASTTRLFPLRLALAAALFSCCVMPSQAGGPNKVAGSAYFDPLVKGQPLTWAQGVITYYTDQGNLSPVLPNSSANSMVAGSFAQWSSVPTAALSVRNGGSLAEDVSGANVARNSDGTISVPLDIQPSATSFPIGIVYDYDGAVTNALLGAGAGDPSQCFYNAVSGGADNYSPRGNYEHALVVINGQCALQSSKIVELQYRLLRVIGSVLGLGWSQLNLNVQTGSPAAGSDDYAGFPLMHSIDLLNCVPITLCYPNPLQLSMDDVASVSRLYPVTPQNQSAFPGKQIFSSSTARIRGSVWFTEMHGQKTQSMQGANVVARWIDTTTGQPSRRFAASSVSGFLFSGNRGNPVTGSDDALAQPLAQWGSDDQMLQGFFDLAGLQVPNGGSAQYQLSVEALDPQLSPGVGPYSPGPVAPSGSFPPVIVTVSAGSDVQQDIVMTGTAQPTGIRTTSWTAPASLPPGGDWVASIGDTGTDYFLFAVKANRTLSIAATALDESSRATQLKAQPVIGMWTATDPEGTQSPAFTASPFNSLVPATTKLDAQVLQPANFLIGFSDVRGDSRPDFRYHGRLLYADTVVPDRMSVNGGVVTVQGTGFARGMTATMGTTTLSQLAVNSAQMTLVVPARSDGAQSVTITDPATGGSSTMTNVLIYGAAASDNIVRLYEGNPQTPVGTQAANPMSVRVVASDGATPVTGATIGWTTSNGLQLSACSGSTSCSAVTDQNGMASTWLTPAAIGVSTVTATLAPGVYSPPKLVSATVNATQSSSDIGGLTPNVWISKGATVTWPITVRAMSNGSPRSGVQINFAIAMGSGKLSAPNAQTNSSGYASVNVAVTQIAAEVRVSACVAPSNTSCASFYVYAVPLSEQKLESVSGAGQVSTGQAFQPLVIRVTNSANPANPVMAAPVTFQTTVLRGGATSSAWGSGETNPINPAEPVILSASQSATVTDINGLANIVPSRSNFSPPLELDVFVNAGTTAVLDFPLQVLSVPPSGGNAPNTLPMFIPARHPMRMAGEAR